ncbi:Alpha-D-kanosaminyltransferase [Planctomycetes bacterium CA13]|uniref:Alpha-D-kanosaminyltransferase n=1 Tax=Novipirellula herctigrandis TaxID=2527986 RepID=A0A5C5Z414_9BACT|nr:Alpha-D-kanosaminyltransferase [Planctomycetes bacterium CA13]
MPNTPKPADFRVAYLVNQYPGISGTFIRREIHALEQLGHPISRYSVRRPAVAVVDEIDVREEQATQYVLDSSFMTILVALGGALMLHPLRFFDALRTAVWFGQRSGAMIRSLIYLLEATVVKRWAERDRIEHIHCHFGTNSTAVATLCRVLGGPKYSFTVHGPEEFDRPEQLGLSKKIALSEFVVGVSSFGRSQLYRWTDFPDWPKVKVVRCGLDATYFDYPKTDPPSAPRLLAIGRLHEQKGMPLLIQAAAELAAEGIHFELTIVGDGALRPTLESMIDRHELREFVKLAGWKTGAEIQGLLNESRVLVMPSFAEGLPVACMESLAMGRPVISTSIAGIPELIRTGVDGWLIPAGSVKSLSRAMKKALTASADELKQLGQTGAARVRQRHDVRREARKLSHLFQGHATKNGADFASTESPGDTPSPMMRMTAPE